MTGAGRPYPVEELLTAVRAEILAELRNDAEGAMKVALSKGRLLSQSGGTREYLFECRTWHDSLDSVPVLARPSRSRKAWDPAEASRAPDGTVRLVTKADPGAAREISGVRVFFGSLLRCAPRRAPARYLPGQAPYAGV
ncbi:hypothetical protein Shyhy01_38250 [Streptomyces hygroscopicus subsp. hygroscopicus]|nr:hypothetical protein Shyhy01_38250 [Streptomyces hygroscopicus subsp. hygroscopicus]